LASQFRDNASSTTVIQLEMIKLRIFEKLRIVSKKLQVEKLQVTATCFLEAIFFFTKKSVIALAHFTKID